MWHQKAQVQLHQKLLWQRLPLQNLCQGPVLRPVSRRRLVRPKNCRIENHDDGGYAEDCAEGWGAQNQHWDKKIEYSFIASGKGETSEG
jgi:hypothetical protein